MFFCKNWDAQLLKEIKNINHNFFYISGMNVSYLDGFINHDCGKLPNEFDPDKFHSFCENDNTPSYQGSHWAPHVVHKSLWNEVGGFSEVINYGIKIYEFLKHFLNGRFIILDQQLPEKANM